MLDETLAMSMLNEGTALQYQNIAQDKTYKSPNNLSDV